MSSPRVAVAAPNALASEAGAAVSADGGNAVDAVVAAMAVACTTEPGIVSLGGGGYATVVTPSGDAVTIDGYVAMPGIGLDRAFDRGFDVHTTYGGGVTVTIGHGTVGTPGTPPMLVDLHRRWGRMPWQDVLAPAVAIAETGFPLGTASDTYLDLIHMDIYGWHEPSRRALHKDDGSRFVLGEQVRVPHLADTLRSWQDDPVTFTHGHVADRIVADIEAHDGGLGHADLRNYQPLHRRPLEVDIAGWHVWTNPPPSVGGPVLAMMLSALGTPPAADGWRPADRARVVEVLRRVLGHRVDVLDVAADRESAGWDAVERVVRDGLAGLTSPSTVHVSATDDDGLAVGVTCSSGYGSGAMPPGTGVWLNNCLGEQELARRGPDGYAPGERLPSNMAPSVARGPDGTVLAAGTPGADRITSSMMQVLAGVAGGMDLRDAIAAPRIHLTRRPDGDELLDVEDGAVLDPSVAPDVTRRAFEHHAMYYGAVSVTRLGSDGALDAAADPRRDGGTAVV